MALRKFKKIVLWFFLSLLFIFIAAWIFIETPYGQKWITTQVTERLSKDLNTKVGIKHIRFSLFDRLKIQGLLLQDRQQDTLVYAGEANVRITDWFFFKKNIELKYIGLEDVTVNLLRSDSVWNYQFLVDYFSSPSSTSEKKGGTQLNLKKVKLKNIVLRQEDEWRGENIVLAFSALDMDARKFDFSSQTINLNSLVIDDPFVSLLNYKGNRPDSLKPVKTIQDPDSLMNTLKWNDAGWIVKAQKIKLNNGIFKHDILSAEPIRASFDDRHIEFAKINADFSDLLWEKDTITAQLVLQTKERSGFEVKNLSANAKFTPQEMAFSNLDIVTNNSHIRNFYRMSYDDFDDMSSFITKVNLQGNFDNSEIDSDDIAFFAPELSSWKKNIVLKGIVRGTISDLVGRNLVIEAGKNTLLNGDISLTGLPDIEKTFIDFKANDFRTTYTDVVSFIPAVRKITTPDLHQLQYVHFKGSFTGFIRDFVTFGTIQTRLGTVKSDLNMKLPSGQPPLYSGTISTENFQLGTLLNDPTLGAVALNGTVKGKGFNARDRQVNMDGNIRYVDYNGYRYSNITVKGNLDKKKFDGLAAIQDTEAELVLNGLIDFNGETPSFNFFADVKKANLRSLNLTKDDIAFNGKFNLNFTGDNIDNFIGYANVTEATITKDGSRLPFDSLIVSSQYINNTKTITVSSNELEGTISGDFSIRSLQNAFGSFLHKYYPSYFNAPASSTKEEFLTFDIHTLNIEDYLRLIDTTITGFNYSHIKGSLDTRSNKISLAADIPQFRYKKYVFNNVNISANGDNDSLGVSGTASNISLSDSLNIPLALFHVNTSNDRSKVMINTGANQAIDKASINANVTTYPNGVKIEFDPSSFVINGKAWSIDETGRLELRSDIPASGLLTLRESNQEITVQTLPSKTGNWNDLIVSLKKVNLGDFSPLLLPKNRLEGLLSGDVLIKDPTNNLFISSDNISGEAIRFDNDSVGNIKAIATYDGKTEQLKANGNTLNLDNYLGFDLNLFLANKEAQKNNRISLEAKTYPLSFLERFLGSLFSDIQGYVTGNFDITGEFDNISVAGKGTIKDAGLKVNFTQCFYKINDTEIDLKPDEIALDGIVLTDPVTGNPIYLNGGIEHTAFKDMFFDVTVSTRKPRTTGPENNRPVLLLNTGYNDNKDFYGRVKGTGSFSLSGTEADMYMKIDAIASTTDSSIVTIPSSTSRETGIADFLIEKKYGREMTETKSDASSKITYDVDVTANPMVTIKVVLDDLTGDEIKGKGSGSLNIRAGTNENMSIRGRFDIEEGDYLFTFQSVFNKPFEIRKGADNYISWSGDPYHARINFEAVYKAVEVNFSPLINNVLTSSSSTTNKLREDVYVIVSISGDLFNLDFDDFDFRLEFPPNSPVNNDFAVTSSMQQLEKNKNEMVRQVTYLIVFNSFAPPDAGSSTASIGFNSALNELTYSTISSLSGLFFNEINKKLNSELSKILKTDNISVNFSGSLYNRNLLTQQNNTGFNINQSKFDVYVPISMFKDRFIVTLGSTLDVPLQSTIQQNVQFLPDVTAEWLINEKGTVRASFFYRQNLDYLTTSSTGAARTKRSGASIAYRKEFNNLKEFFTGKNNDRKASAPPPAQPKDSIPE
jgi:hypothetical protein